MEPPRVKPVGLLETGPDFARPPRRCSAGRRWLVLALLSLFALTTLVSSAVSLGRYCLATDGGDTRELQGR